jgi:hypothetical protein
MPVVPPWGMPLANLPSSGVDIMVEVVLQYWPQKQPETVALVCIDPGPTRFANALAAGRDVAEVLQYWPQKQPETVAFVYEVLEPTRLAMPESDGLKGVAATHG